VEMLNGSCVWSNVWLHLHVSRKTFGSFPFSLPLREARTNVMRQEEEEEGNPNIRSWAQGRPSTGEEKKITFGWSFQFGCLHWISNSNSWNI
jgi:hypothetical protein